MSTPSSEQSDGITELLQEHQEVKEAFQQLERGLEPARRRDLLQSVAAALSRHTRTEERHLYPLVRKALLHGNDIADHEARQHDEISRLLHLLRDMDDDDPHLQNRMLQLISETLHHMHEEESDLFPQLRAECHQDELRSLGERVRAARGTV